MPSPKDSYRPKESNHSQKPIKPRRTKTLSFGCRLYRFFVTDRKFVTILTLYSSTRILFCATETRFSCTLINPLLECKKAKFLFSQSTDNQGSKEFSAQTKSYLISLDTVTKYLFTYGRRVSSYSLSYNANK